MLRYLSILMALAMSALSASSSNFFWEIGARGGYRQDDFNYRLYLEELPSQRYLQEDFKGLAGPQVSGFLSFLFYYLELGIDADYAWVKRGHVKSRVWIKEIITPEVSHFISARYTSTPKGELWDAFGRAKIHFPLYSRGWTKFALIPEGGYSIHCQSIERENTLPPFADIAPVLIYDSANLSVDFPGRFKRTWWGPFVGGNILFETERFFFDGGYTYHWLDLKQTFKMENTLKLASSNMGTMTQVSATLDNTLEVYRNIGHRGYLTLARRFAGRGRIGVHGTYFLIKTPRKPSVSRNGELTRPDIRTRWQTFTASLEAALAY